MLSGGQTKWALWTGLQSGGSGTVGGLVQERWVRDEQMAGTCEMGRNCSCIGHTGRLGSLSACMFGFPSLHPLGPSDSAASFSNKHKRDDAGGYIYTHTVSKGRGERTEHMYVHKYQPGPDQRHVSGTRTLFRVINIRRKHGKAGRDRAGQGTCSWLRLACHGCAVEGERGRRGRGDA